MEASEPQRTFIKEFSAVSLYHLSNCNWRGAVILLRESLQRYSPTHAGIDVTELVTSSAALLATLQNAGPEKIGDWVATALGE